MSMYMYGLIFSLLYNTLAVSIKTILNTNNIIIKFILHLFTTPILTCRAVSVATVRVPSLLMVVTSAVAPSTPDPPTVSAESAVPVVVVAEDPVATDVALADASLAMC